jgi:hypothetical protein
VLVHGVGHSPCAVFSCQYRERPSIYSAATGCIYLSVSQSSHKALVHPKVMRLTPSFLTLECGCLSKTRYLRLSVKGGIPFYTCTAVQRLYKRRLTHPKGRLTHRDKAHSSERQPARLQDSQGWSAEALRRCVTPGPLRKMSLSPVRAAQIPFNIPLVPLSTHPDLNTHQNANGPQLP